MGLNTQSLSKLFCYAALVIGVLLVFLLPAQKVIWYDESISVLCSKGISYGSSAQFSGRDTILSGQVAELNNFSDVYTATVRDNANSFLYNIGLHWFTDLFGNTLTVYTVFSKLLALCTLLAFFVLSRRLMGYHLFTGVAILMLVANGVFFGMSHEVRAYMMGMLFSLLTGLAVFRTLREGPRPGKVLIASLCAVAAILCHFLSVYIIITLFIFLLIVGKRKLFSVTNIFAMVAPALILAVYFYKALEGLKIMQGQNNRIATKVAGTASEFSLGKVVTESLRLMSLDFSIELVSFASQYLLVIVASFAIVVVLFGWAFKVTKDSAVRLNLLFLFCTGISGGLFLAALCMRSGHMTAIYGRYHSFGVPFATLFSVYALYVISQNVMGRGRYMHMLLSMLVIIPSVFYFARVANALPASDRYNQNKVADAIAGNHADRVVVPHIRHAFLIQCFLPQETNVAYIIDSTATQFTLYTPSGVQKMNILADPE